MQLAHVDVGDSAVDLTVGLSAGCYIAQVRQPPDTISIVFATAPSAPSDPLDWFEARGQTYFTFRVGADIASTWARAVLAGSSVPVALARTDD